MLSQSEADDIQRAGNDLVERSRLGDQNATATIAVIRANASRGHPRARQALAALHLAVRRTPSPTPDIGAEAEDAIASLGKVGPIMGLAPLFRLPNGGNAALFAGSIVLANGPPITTERIDQIGALIPDDTVRQFFAWGFQGQKDLVKANLSSDSPPFLFQAAQIGNCLRQATKLQLVRRPDMPISVFCPCAAWELGE